MLTKIVERIIEAMQQTFNFGHSLHVPKNKY